LWKATKNIKRVKKPSPPTSQGTWARSSVGKENTFAEHIAKVFQPYSSENEPKEEAHNFLRPHINLNHKSTVSKEPKLKKSPTA
jgi:hypothetical protein